MGAEFQGRQGQREREPRGEEADSSTSKHALSLEDLIGPVRPQEREVSFPRDFTEKETAQIRESAREADKWHRLTPPAELGELSAQELAIRKYLRFAGRSEAAIAEVLEGRRNTQNLKAEWDAELQKLGLTPGLSIKEARREIKQAKRAGAVAQYARNEEELANQVDEFLATIDDRIKVAVKDIPRKLKEGGPLIEEDYRIETNIAFPLEGFEFGRRKWSEGSTIKLISMLGIPYAIYKLCCGRRPELRCYDPNSIKSPNMERVFGKLRELGFTPRYSELIGKRGVEFVRLNLDMRDFLNRK